MAEGTMREVVQRIRAENCRAMLELRAFHYALEDVVKNIEQIATAADEIHLALKDTGALVKERAERLSIHTTQTLLALRALRVAALSWNVAGQSALHRTAMRGVVERLRAERGDAMVELRAFDSSLDHLLLILGLLAVAAGDVQVAVQNVGPPDTIDGYRRLKAARECADELISRSTQVLLAARAMRSDVACWKIMGTDGGPNEPSDDGSSSRSTPRNIETKSRSMSNE